MTLLRSIFHALLFWLAAAGLVQWYALLTHEPFTADGVCRCDGGEQGKDLS